MESLLRINENNFAYSSSIEVLVCSFIELIHFATVDSLIITYMNNKKGDFFFFFLFKKLPVLWIWIHSNPDPLIQGCQIQNIADPDHSTLHSKIWILKK